MSQHASIPLNEFSSKWNFLPQNMEENEIPEIDPVTSENHKNTMIEVPGGSFKFKVKGNCIEGDDLVLAVDVQFPWEETPRRYHSQNLDIKTLLVDKYPVTNSDYKAFLLESGWSPEIKQNWLFHWYNFENYPPGFEKKPVVWVSHADAVAYCKFYQKR